MKDTRENNVLPYACTHIVHSIVFYYILYCFDLFDHCHYSASLYTFSILHPIDLYCVELVYAMVGQLYIQTMLSLLPNRKNIDIDFFCSKLRVNLRFIINTSFIHSFFLRTFSRLYEKMIVFSDRDLLRRVVRSD